MLLDRGLGAFAEHAVDADGAGLALQPAGIAHGAEQEGVVRGGGHGRVEVVVRLVEHVDLAVDDPVPALLHGDLDRAQLGRSGTGGRETAGGRLLDLAEVEEHQDVVEVDRAEEPAPATGDEHALVVRDEQAAPLVRPDPAECGQDLHGFPDHRPAGVQRLGQVVLGGQPVTCDQVHLGDVLEDLLRHDLVPGPVVPSLLARAVRRCLDSGGGLRGQGRLGRGRVVHLSCLPGEGHELRLIIAELDQRTARGNESDLFRRARWREFGIQSGQRCPYLALARLEARGVGLKSI